MTSISIEGLNLSPLGSVSAKQLHQYVECEDGWVIKRSVVPAEGGLHDGKYVVLGYRPVGPGARQGRGAARRWALAYHRGFKLRRGAKARAVALWREHCPTWDAKHPKADQ